MPAPGVSSEEAKKIKEAKSKQDAAAAKHAKKIAQYKKEASSTTVADLVDASNLEKTFFTQGEWQPAWGHVEFVSSVGSVLSQGR